MSTKQIAIQDMVEQISMEEIPDNIKDFYNNISQSVLKQIRKSGIRKHSSNHIDQWVRIRFPLNEDKTLVKKHQMAATHVSKYLLRQTNDYKIPLNEVQSLLKLDRKLQEQQKREIDKFKKLKAEVEEIRLKKRKLRKPRSKAVLKKVINKNPINHTTKKHQTPNKKFNAINYDFIYSNWMDHVEIKSTSKSYWYIHEYIGRYILNFAIKRKESTINQKIVQEFLGDYGKGKAAKTMNHYTRVAKYFLEFCQSLNNSK
ncbi:MAG: hypothetical protein HeimC2_37190 [Candidatus Heimdallarchaeota archaeon LC_2]|nr:MAG: hypothetical protein HeimC2_37190 [Candidatus Heimdallarchaeota archaeon LC_2]